MEDMWSHSGGEVWAPRFSRRLNDWEVFDVEHFLLRLQGRRVCSDVEDQVIWTKAKEGRFSIKSLQGVGTRKTKGFSCKSYLEFIGASEGEFFCLEGYVEKGLNLGSYSEKRVLLG